MLADRDGSHYFMIYYYGTSLDESGHFYWKLQGDYMFKDGLRHTDFSFDPEDFPKVSKGESRFRGLTKHYFISGYKILAIEGSCIDGRPGSKSIFFTKDNLSDEEMALRLNGIPVVNKILRKLFLGM